MKVIDSDAHVVETERTWDFIPSSLQHLRPIVVNQPDATGSSKPYWLIDGKIRGTVRQPIGKRDEWDPGRVSPDMAAVSQASGRKVDTPDASKHM